MARSSASVYTMPVGLEGLLSISALVRGVIAASSCAGAILKPAASAVSTTTGTPPHMLTISQ